MEAVIDTLQRSGLNERAYEILKNDIIWCRLSPGTEVSEARLVSAYGFGKAPIRYALSKLSQEGYVVSIPRRGHLIAPVTLQTVNEIFEMRILLEPRAVEKACGRIEPDLLIALGEKCAAGFVPGDLESEGRFIADNKAFHMEIVRASGNERMTRVLGHTMDEMTRLLHLGFVLKERPKELECEHQELIDALIENDAERAAELTVAHIGRVRSLVLEGIMTRSNLCQANIAPA